jgi:putative ABC transport system permease protein
MRLITLVLKHLSRRKGRLVLNTLGLILATAVIVSTYTISGAMEIQIGEEVEKYGPNIVVKPESSSITIPYGSVVVGRSTFPESYIKALATIPNSKNLRIVSPKVFGQVEYRGNTILVVGVDPESEYDLKIWWRVDGDLPRENSNEALLGSEIKSTLGLALGSSFRLGDTEFTVTGFLDETGSNDDYTVYLPLHIAQELLDMRGEVSLVDVGALCSDCPVEEISQQIMEVIPGVRASPVKQAVETRMEAVEQTARFSLMLASVVLVAGCAGVMNTMVSSIHERRREIGVFMSLGADDSYVYRMFLLESVILGLIGGVLGTGLGLAASILLGSFMLTSQISTGDIPMHIVPLAVALSLVACLVSSLYPTWRATKIDPVSALKVV